MKKNAEKKIIHENYKYECLLWTNSLMIKHVQRERRYEKLSVVKENIF